MARKDPTDLTVEEKLKALFQLQLTLSQIDEKRAIRGELPLEVEDLENEVEGLNVRMEKIQHEIDEYDAAVAQRRADIEEAKASVARYNKQLDEVRNNREYDTLTKEIEFQELEIQLCEKKIKEAMQKIDERRHDMRRAEDQLNDRETALEEKRASSTKSCRRHAKRRKSSRLRQRTTRLASRAVSSPASSASARMPAMVSASFTYSVMPAVVASIRFRLSASSTSRCTRRLSSANTVAASLSTQNWLVSRLTSQ